MLINIYKELNLVVKREVVYGICCKLHGLGLIGRSSTPGSYKKLNTTI